jgi:CheY-like chemotaxis protein
LLVEKLLDKFNVILAENGKSEWVQVFKYGNNIDLVLLDVEMPEMNGINYVKKQ